MTRILAAAPGCGPALVVDVRPAVRFATRRQPDAAMDVGHSKLGGAPDLPQGTRWPASESPGGERAPLQFFAQIDLAAVAAAAPAPVDLPNEGLLSFFADFAGDGRGDGPAGGPDGVWVESASVLWAPPGSHLVRCSPRLRPLPSAELKPLGTWTWPEPAGLPPADTAGLASLAGSLEAEMRSELPEPWMLRAGHQFAGHVAAASGLAGERAGFRVVLQLDSDLTLDLSWGSGGSLLWAVPETGGWEPARFALRTRRERAGAPDGALAPL